MLWIIRTSSFNKGLKLICICQVALSLDALPRPRPATHRGRPCSRSCNMKSCVTTFRAAKEGKYAKQHDVSPAIRSSELQIFISRISVKNSSTNKAFATWGQNHPLPLHDGTDLCLACTLGPWWAAYAAPAAARRLQTRRLPAFHFFLALASLLAFTPFPAVGLPMNNWINILDTRYRHELIKTNIQYGFNLLIHYLCSTQTLTAHPLAIISIETGTWAMVEGCLQSQLATCKNPWSCSTWQLTIRIQKGKRQSERLRWRSCWNSIYKIQSILQMMIWWLYDV